MSTENITTRSSNDVREVFKNTAKDFKSSGHETWEGYLDQKKIDQSVAKLEALGYYYDCGRYGWLEVHPKVPHQVRDFIFNEDLGCMAEP